MSWILGILIVLLYILHIYCFIVQVTFMFFFFFFHFLFVELMSDAALISKLDMSTPTPIKVDD